MARKTEALVIGAGPGGYVASIRLGQLKKKVILVDRDKLGGECLNYGCIPSKALIWAADLVHKAKLSADIGIEVQGVSIDMEKLQSWKSAVVERLRGGIEKLCKGNGVEILYGDAKFLSAKEVEVKTLQGKEIIEAENIIIATGSRRIPLPGFEFDGKLILSSREVLELSKIPKNFLIIGGGITGLEMATMFAKLGSHVTVVELLEQLLPGMDPELVRVISRSLRNLGVKYYVKSKAKSLERKGDSAIVCVETPEGEVEIEADRILVTIGRRANVEGLGLERAGIHLDDKGFVKVDSKLRTNVPGIYAIGDVNGQPFLAHRASKEGIVAAEVIAGLPSAVDYKAMPSAIFTDPEIATVGLSEEEARQKGYKPSTGRFPFAALGRALTTREEEGFVKVVADADSNHILGVQIVGSGASDMISEATLSIEMGASLEDVALTVHPHPTLPEAFMEAAEAALGRAIHVLKR